MSMSNEQFLISGPKGISDSNNSDMLPIACDLGKIFGEHVSYIGSFVFQERHAYERVCLRPQNCNEDFDLSRYIKASEV
ncbi:hypothetical protein AKJ16_DCAP23673 [Drosera capensis]